MTRNLTKKFFSGVIHQYNASLITFVFGLLTSIYIIRKLSIEGFGIYNLIISLITTAQFITSFGLTQTVIRYLPEYRQKRNNYVQKRIALIAVLMRFLLSVIFVSILIICEGWILDIFSLPAYFSKLFPMIIIIILLALESQVLGEGVLRALLDNKYWNLCRSIYAAIKFLAFYAAISMGYELKGLVFSWLVIETVLLSFFLARVHKLIFSLPSRSPENQSLPLRRFINFGKYVILSQTVWFLRDKAPDIFIITYFLGINQAGLYSFAFGIPFIFMGFSPGSILRAIFTVFLVETYSKTNDKKKLSYFFGLINKTIFFTMVPLFVILIILADKVILYVFDPTYLEVTNLFVLSLAFLVVGQFAYAYTPIIYTLEKTKIIFWGSLFAVYNLVMDLFLIPVLGILGAILATGSAGILLLFYYYIVFKRSRMIELGYPWKSFLKFSVNLTVTAIYVALLKPYIINLFSLLTISATAGILYLFLSWVHSGFEQEDIRIFRRAFTNYTFFRPLTSNIYYPNPRQQRKYKLFLPWDN